MQRGTNSPKRAGQLLISLLLVFAALFTTGLLMYATYRISHEGATTTPSTIATTSAPGSSFLHEEEVVVVEKVDKEQGLHTEALPVEKVLFEYIEVTDGCGIHFEGECLNVRSGPGTEFEVLAQLRNHVVLKVGGKVENEDRTWYKITFDEWLRYPERLGGDWYVAADHVEVLLDEGDMNVWENKPASTTKRIVVDRSKQYMYAYDGDKLFMGATTSTGLELTPTPRGTFAVYKKTPSRYMQGPIPGIANQYYDMPGVPWNLYFTEQGAVIHGAYWHDSFGTQYSHGCVNLPPEDARKLYNWADLGTTVTVQ